MVELQPLGAVHGHEPHGRGLALAVTARRQRRMIEEFAGGMEVRGERDQLLEIIEPTRGVGLAFAKPPAIAAGVQKQGELIRKRVGGILADAADLVGQGQSLISGFRRKRGRFESGEKRDVAERRLLLDDRERPWPSVETGDS